MVCSCSFRSIRTVAGALLSGMVLLCGCSQAHPGKHEDVPVDKLEGADMVLYNLYEDNFRTGDYAGAAGYAELFLEKIDTASISSAVGKMYDRLSDYCAFSRYCLKDAIMWREKALRVYSALDDKESKAVADFELALFYMDLEQYHKTLVHINDAYEFFRKQQDTAYMAECCNVLGIVYHICRDEKKSRSYFQQYLDMALRTGNKSQQINALCNMVRAFPEDTVKNSSLFTESLEVSREIQDTAKLCEYHLNLADMFIATHSLDEAEAHLEQAWSCLRSRADSGSYFMYRGIAAHEAGNNDGAIADISRALTYFSAGDFRSEKERCHSILHKLYFDSGRFEDAYRSLASYNDLYEEKNMENVFIELFHAENEIKGIKEAEQKRYDRMVLVAVSSVTLLVLSILLFFIVVFIRKRMYSIKEKEKELQHEHEKMEIGRLQQYTMDCFIKDIIENLREISAECKDTGAKARLERLRSGIISSKESGQWESMKRYVPEFNTVFYANLLKYFPDLTVNERRLCALLNLNLSTKEISEITRQTPHSINVARSRLRNKFNITGDNISIQEFLHKYNNPEQ